MSNLGKLKINDKIINHLKIPNDFNVGGWVYVLENPSMPGIYKIGATRNHPEIRAKELSQPTGVPTAFKVDSSYFSDEPFISEAEIHDQLASYRVNNSREFFKCPIEKIRAVCRKYCIAESESDVAGLAMDYSLISFENIEEIDFESLFEELQLNSIGCKLAIAERLIRLGANLIKEQNKSLDTTTVFEKGVMYQIRSLESQNNQKTFDANKFINDLKGGENI